MVRSPYSSGQVSLDQVAAAAGVSRATASRVVNGLVTVAPDLRERVQRAIDELGYTPNMAARSLATNRTNALALVACEPDQRVFGDPFFAGIVRGASQETMSAGLQLTLLMAQSFTDLDRIQRYLGTAPVDGVLLISVHTENDPLPAALTRSGTPLVIGGRPTRPELAVPYVDNDNVGGGRLAAQHLEGLGRSIVGTVTGPLNMSAGVDRLAGFKQGLGRRFRSARVESGDFTQVSGERATLRLLERVPDLDGLFVASDLMALGALKALRQSGRRVPEDVAVVGFDDIDLAAAADPPLTTVRQETILMGRAMVRLYLSHHRSALVDPAPGDLPDLTGSTNLVLPVRLIVRDSA